MTQRQPDRAEACFCKRCRQYKPRERFLAWATRGGKAQPRGHCLDCRENFAEERKAELIENRRIYNINKRSVKRERDHQRRLEVKAAVNKIKDTPCADCGQSFPAVAMDFDHVGAKTRSIANMVSGAYKLDLILEEIKKCEIICACCHRIRTAARKENCGLNGPQPRFRLHTVELREAIMRLFKQDALTPRASAEIARQLGRAYHSTEKALRSLVRDDQLATLAQGIYCLAAAKTDRCKLTAQDEDALVIQQRALASLALSDRIITLFAMNPLAILTPTEIGERIRFDQQQRSIAVVLYKLKRAGKITRVARGRYRLPTPEEAATAKKCYRSLPHEIKSRRRLAEFQETSS
jgi:hypothetical protein